MRHRIANAALGAALALLALPGAGAAHPGHEHAGLVGGALHHVLEPGIVAALVGIAAAALRRTGRAQNPDRRGSR